MTSDAVDKENMGILDNHLPLSPPPVKATTEPAPQQHPIDSSNNENIDAKENTLNNDNNNDDNNNNNTDDVKELSKKKKRPTVTKKEAAATPSTITQYVSKYAYDPEYVKSLSLQYPDTYWSHIASPSAKDETEAEGMIAFIDEENPLVRVDCDIRDQGPITGITLSPDGSMLVTFSNIGSACIWDTDSFQLLSKIRDVSEPNIDEFFVGQFTPSCSHLVIGGKLKDRKRWSEMDEDNHILACPIKVFDTLTGKVVTKWEGHEEEILCLKQVEFKEKQYWLSTSQDGYINRWEVESDWITLKERTRMADGITCMAFTVSFVPHTGNKYFLAACDDRLKIFDFEHARVLQTFESLYSSYCDCAKFITCIDLPPTPTWDSPESSSMYSYFVTRGVELLDAEDNTVNSIPNTVRLHKLIYPTTAGTSFKIEEVRKYKHDDYNSNSWLIKTTSNGRYILAPTFNGQVFVFNIATGEVTGVFRDHEEIEVRDVMFHPRKKLVFTCADDGSVRVYRSVKA